MLFWIFAAALTVAVLLLIVPPLLKPAETAPARDAYDREVYRDQLDELERDRARGLVNAAQAEAAKAEIARRMLATAPAAPGGEGAPRAAKALAVVLALAVPVGALGVYGAVGRPDEPARPLASRNLEQERGGPPKSVLAAIDKLKQQLAETPDDPQGWAILGQAYIKMNRNPEAVDALRRATALAKDDTELLGLFGETLVEGNDGTVPEEARVAFDGVLAKDPKDARARFFVALARYQAGDRRDALDRWRALLAESPANASWVPVVRDQIREAAVALDLDPAVVTPEPLPPKEAPAAAAAQAPQQPAVPPSAQERDQMVRGMVDSLAAKLAADPSDVNGWLTLARSYGVLGEPAKAMEAVRNAKQRAPDRPDVLVAYASAVLQGLPRSDPPAPMPEEATAALRQALAADTTNRDALWLLGLDAVTVGRKAEAMEYWTRLIAQFTPSDPEYALLKTRLESLKAGS
ncbi:c-type cytochrome biogenesis protein CcmI [Azospirillum doebereinerae]|uniref:C-type cytochrome biogenesis protein CcmI n=1 Tax=Azospirillum doebereinerae TaxID=92933 RepID=A0A3S0WN26_9PROT|nr:c-type cytochrome biogenesis protein CcmI [Azospirillum doebereinerae]RUQ73681.1 c-type cytochrome biogenesis protein CcmI [Azospirillum doebereinerae]